MKVCLGANTHELPRAGGHLWAHLSWALGLRDNGVEVVWLEQVDETRPPEDLARAIGGLRARLEPFGLENGLAVAPRGAGAIPSWVAEGCLDLESAAECDLLLDIGNKIAPEAVSRFRRSALLDIDPGVLQIWVSAGRVAFPEHDLYFTIGETVGTSAARFPDCGVAWRHVPPAVHLGEWEPAPAPLGAPYTTVSSWWGWWEESGGEHWDNQKRAGFLDLLDLPARVSVELELALALWGHADHEDVRLLRSAGWRVVDAHHATSTPDDYRAYVRASRAELSPAKPSCVRLQNAWISDRTLCYLAMGRPCVVQDTGPSRYLPEAAGVLRFHDAEGAVRAIRELENDYDRHAREARALAEAFFDARSVAARVLEATLP